MIVVHHDMDNGRCTRSGCGVASDEPQADERCKGELTWGDIDSMGLDGYSEAADDEAADDEAAP